MSHLHIVHDSDAHFTIDPVTREIINESKKVTVIQHDHNSERFTFSIQKQVEGHNMTACNRVEIHYINIDATDKTKKATGMYEADDLKISSDDSGKVTFSWLLSRNATQYAGSLNFLIRFACTTDGVEEYAWNTAIFQSITVGSGMYYGGEEVIDPYLDVIAQWRTQLFEASDTAVLNVTTAETNALAAIEAAGEAKKQSVLDSIPDEYEALQAQADENARNKAGAIVLDTEGKSVVVNDASDCHLQGLKLFGKSTQNGTPSQDAPVDIVSVENANVRVYGKNLLKNIAANSTSNGITFTINEDGSVTVDGTATAGAWLNVSGKFALPKGTYILSGCPDGGVYVQRVHKLVSDYATGWKISGNSTTNHNAFYRMNTALPTMIKGTNQPVICTHFTMTRDPVADHTTCVSGGLSNQEMYFFVPKTEFPDEETWTNYVVDQAYAGTPITTYYILSTPIETPLSDVEIAAFKALHSNKPTTAILNDAGAYMAVEYVADTKTYIDNKIAEALKGSE